ncbi:MAG: nicotinate-nucleotide--dimethylbenzimidazole phosphoribosyltransferase [Nitrospinota bacterium]|nr:nicotinate-nucleotide--dimethylbenzimidazole phosphoribosyltransferase [Nitrospinota bacterium]
MSLLENTVNSIKPLDAKARGDAKARLDQLTMPHWALGRLMDLALELAAMTGKNPPPVARKTIVTMAGDHGVTESGVSQYPSEVTAQMVHNFVSGGAGVNALAGLTGAKVVVVDMGVNGDLSALGDKIIHKKIGMGTKNIAKGPAMTRDEAIRSVEAGIEVAMSLADSTDIFGAGEMGIGNTTPASAIVAAVTGGDPAKLTGRGTGIDEDRLVEKIKLIKQILETNKPDKTDGLDLLEKIGGYEIGGMAGVIIGAASLRKPVLVDGFISTAGAIVASLIAPAVKEYMIAAHESVEPGHQAMLGWLDKRAFLDMNMRLGEGSGAALAMCLVDAASNVLTKVATFQEAAVSTSDK